MFQFRNEFNSKEEKKRQNTQMKCFGLVFFLVKQSGLFGNYCKEIFVIPNQSALFDLRNTVSFHLEKNNVILYWPEMKFVIMFDSSTWPKKSAI